jgi:hypothetical protein
MLKLITHHHRAATTCSKGATLAFIQLTFLMMGLSLFIDAINGFFLSGLGIDTKLSAIYKLVLLCIILFQIGAFSQKTLACILMGILILMMGPTVTLTSTLDVSGFFLDFTTVLKITTAFIVFLYCVQVCKKSPELVEKYGKWCCQFSFVILAVNLALGVMGFGFSSYGGETTDESTNIGIKGFFYAGNEVSGIFILLFGTTLHLLWQKHRTMYFFFVPLVFIAGLLIATKAAMLAAALLVFAIPLFNERNRLLNVTWLKVKMILPVVIVTIVLLFILVPVFQSTGLWERFVWFYQKKGVIGIILSGRDEFIIAALVVFQQFADLSQILLGFGRSGLGMFTKDSMEVDPVDMYFWFGIAGLAMFMLLATVFFRVSYLATRQKYSLWGPSVLVINIALFSVSMIAGHIVTSGMLAPLFGLINGMAYADLCLLKNKTKRDNGKDEGIETK